MEVSPKTRGSQTALTANYSSDQPELELINPPYSPVKGDTNPDDGMVVEALGAQEIVIEILLWESVREDTDQGDDESNSDSDSRESAANSSPESAGGDSCLIC